MPESSPERRLVVVLGLDSVRKKALYQTRWFADRGWMFHLLVAHRDPGSITSDPSALIEATAPGAVARIAQAGSLLWRRRRELHHVELYPGGRFAFVYALVCRLLRAPLMVVERGDLMMCQRKLYPLPTRLSMYACYQLAGRIWFKEVYMERALRRWGLGRRSFFLPNAVPLPTEVERGPRDIDFLWANRVVPERHVDWLADALATQPPGRQARAVFVGFSGGSTTERVSRYEHDVHSRLGAIEGVACLDWGDPHTLYGRSRFFLFPAEVVFANYALLEAMGHGVVPVVSDVEGTERLVRHLDNGIVAPLTPGGVAAALQSALELPDDEWQRMSKAARAMIEEGYSLDAWGEHLLAEYGSQSSGDGGRFEFGRNWQRFLRELHDDQVEEATRALESMVGADRLRGARFVDVGSGSGLSSLAARHLGATVHSFDLDAESVACTAALRARYAPDDPGWVVERGSATDEAYLRSLGTFDVVYSWGVLHHTGAMWDALDRVAGLVAPGGLLHVALYNDQGRWSGLWRRIKRTYVRGPRLLRPVLLAGSAGVLWSPRLARFALRGRPLDAFRTYRGNRGMSMSTDLVDWVGGYPFEVARPGDVFDFFEARGWSLRRLVTQTGLGCNEYVFERPTDSESASAPDARPPSG